jgi:CRP-like cAMP-binding protein
MTTVDSSPSLTIREGVTVVLDEQHLERHRSLTVTAGLVRVAASRLEEELLEVHPMTLGFLQAGDQMALDLLWKKRLHLHALCDSQLEESGRIPPAADGNSLHDWTMEMLLIRNLCDAEHRISALLQLLVRHFGHRRGAWYELSLPLTHADLAELCGHTRVTVSRQFSRWRSLGLLEQDPGPQRLLRLAPELVEYRAA